MDRWIDGWVGRSLHRRVGGLGGAGVCGSAVRLISHSNGSGWFNPRILCHFVFLLMLATGRLTWGW